MTEETRYRVNEIFYSVQGEGIRAGTPNVFIRFSGCNMRCEKAANDHSPGGFDCDTEFVSGRMMLIADIHREVDVVRGDCKNIIFTGGEPGLQFNEEIAAYFKKAGFFLAIETNGSVGLPPNVLDWITVSPKVAEHAIKQLEADEVKYVRGYGQAIPHTAVKAKHYLISPAFDGPNISKRTLNWCVQLVKENPKWRLSLQTHKFLEVR